MAEPATLDYQAHRVFARDAISFIVRSCVQRNSDGWFAVAHIERVSFDGGNEPLEEVGTPWEILEFTTEDAALWDWRSTLEEAIAAHDAVFDSYDDWIRSAQN